MMPTKGTAAVVTEEAPPELNPTNILHSPACSLEQLCGHCLSLRPLRGKRDFAGTILTDYERMDEYPSYPSLRETAEKGCRMCGFLRASLTAVQNPRSHEAEPNETHPFWGPTGEDVALHLPWDRRISIEARFEYEPFNGSGGSSPNDTPYGSTSQQGGMVISMWLIYKPASGSLRDDRGNIWGSSVLVFSAFDSIGRSSIILE